MIEKILKESPERIAPACPNFETCGGCDHMNISYQNQLKWKEEIFSETLRRAGLNTKPLPIIAGSQNEYFYRNSIRFFFLKDPNGIKFARHNYLYKEGLVQVDSCLLQSEKCNEILKLFKEVYSKPSENYGSLWQLKIREGKFCSEFMIEIITTSEFLPKEKEVINALKEIREIKSIYHTVAAGGSLKNLRRRLLFGAPIIFEKIGKFKFQVSPESFFQTNSLGVKTLYDKIKEFADVKVSDKILDLYCGTGTIGIYLSTLAKKVVGVEIVPEAIRDAKDNAKINHISNCEFICADASKIGNWKLARPVGGLGIDDYDVIVIDPPRAGLSKELIKEIVNCKPVNCKLVYVSCNPATFARDVKIFEGHGLELKKVQPIDMFPQTHHIECVGVLSK